MSTDWSQDPAWDTCILGGKQLPGVVRVSVSLPSGLDVQKPKGGKQATIVDDGDPPADVDIEIEITEDDIPAFRSCIPVLRARSKNGARDPLAIVHPNTAMWGITSITVGDIESPPPSPGGSQVIRVRAVEWAPAPTKVRKPKDKPKEAEDDSSWAPFREDSGQLMSVAPSEDENSADNLMSTDPLQSLPS